MKRSIVFLTLILTALLLLASCGRGEPNTLFDKAAPEGSVMILLVAGENGTVEYWLSDDVAEKQLLDALTHTAATPAEVTTKDVTFPIYSMSYGHTDIGRGSISWSNGYLYDYDGQVYAFDFDFEQAIEEYGLTFHQRSDGAQIANARFLVLDESGWDPTFMTPAEDKYAPSGIVLEATLTGGTMSATLKNNSDTGWTFGEPYSIEVKLGERWYIVPTTPEKMWSFTSIAYLLPAGGERKMSYSLDRYGDLPAGRYRLVVNGLTQEFDIS